MARQVNGAGLALIKKYESLQTKAYRCPAGVLTIGYGHTGVGVHEGQVITESQADLLLRGDVEKAASTVERLTSGIYVSDNEFSAMVSLCFNIGGTAFAGSTLLKYVNKGRYEQAADEFLKWCHAGGKELAGLKARREDERTLFLLS